MSDLVADPGLALPLHRFLVDLVADGLHASGAQAYLAVGGEAPVRLAVGEDGMGRPMAADTLFNLHCAAKPFAAVCLLADLDHRGIPVGARLADVLDGLAPVHPLLQEVAATGVRLDEVMAHGSWLSGPSAWVVRSTPPDGRLDVLRPAFLDRARAPGYCDYAPHWVVLRVLEALGHGDPARHVERFVGSLTGEELHLRPGADELAGLRPRLGAFVFGLPTEPTPLLTDRLPGHLADLPETGGYGTTGTLGALLRVVGTARREGTALGRALDVAAGHRRGPVPDARLRRVCDFDPAFMVDLVGHGFPDCVGPRAFGHSAFMGVAFGLHDPDADLTFACLLNGIAPTMDDVHHLRAACTRMAYEAAG